MNMVDNRKFRRKHRSATERIRTADAQRQAEEQRRKAEAQRHAELQRRKAEAEAQRQAEAQRRKAEAEAEDQRQAEAQRRKAEAEAQRQAEAQRRKAEAQRQAEAQRRKAEALRETLAHRRQLAEQRARDARAEALRLEEEARRAAADEARLTGAVPDPKTDPSQDAQAYPTDRPKPPPTPDTTGNRPAPLPLTDPVVAAEPPAPSPSPRAPKHSDTAWAQLSEITVDARHLHRNRIITAARDDPAHTSFDVLRTRLLHALAEHGWKRVAITSPGKDCGKTFTAANLAISLSRQENCRTLLLDCDMRRPSLHKVMGIDKPGSVGDMLRGKTSALDHLQRMGVNPVHAGRNIAFGFNDTVEPYAAELLQDPRTALTLKAMEHRLAPDVMLFDLPPALFYDDVIAFRPQFDGVLLVIGGGLTTETEVKEVERRLGAETPLLGMVLNKAEGTESERYTY